MRVNSYSGGQNNFYGNNNYGSQDINSYGKRSTFFNLYFENQSINSWKKRQQTNLHVTI